MSANPRTFEKDGYQVIRGALSQELCSFVSAYYRLLKDNNYLQYNDGQVEKGYAAYGIPISEVLLGMLTPLVAETAGVPLHPTYSYSRLYLKGAELEPHKDRPSCEISATLTVGFRAPAIWPIFVKSRDDRDIPVDLAPGDFLVYQGAELSHWRETFVGDWHLQIFLHYVRQGGDFDAFKFDSRPRLGAPISSKRIKRRTAENPGIIFTNKQ